MSAKSTTQLLRRPKLTGDTPSVEAPAAGIGRNNGPQLLTVEQVGKQLQVSRYTIWRLCRDGKFPLPLKIGSRSRWHQADIDTFTAELRA